VSAELASRGSVKLLTLSAVPIDDFIQSLKGGAREEGRGKR
jgi:uncharacterized protein with GYD domain